LTRLVQETDIDVVMLSGRYTLLDHSAIGDLLPACAARRVSVLAASIFNSGVLATPRPGATARFDYEPATPQVLPRAPPIPPTSAARGGALPHVGVTFPP